MPESLRIALVSREYPPFFGGGIGTYARWIVPALVEAGCRVHVVTEGHADEPDIHEDGAVTVHRVPLVIGGGGWTGAALRFSALAGRVVASLARRGKIDVAEFAECEASGLATGVRLAAAGGPRLGTVVHLHTPSEVLFELRSLSSKSLDAEFMSYVLAERAALHLADTVCAPSGFIADFAHEHYRLAARPEVVPYAIPPLPDLPPAGQPGRVVYVGRIEPRKGVEVLVRAWAGISRRHPGASLRLVGADTSGAPGGGSMRSYLERVTREAGAVEGSVVFVGKLRPEELVREYKRASVSVVPSLWENFPNTCIESMSYGRAVVASDHGGMREMIEHASSGSPVRAGEVFQSGDVSSLERVLGDVLAERPASLRERGLVGRAGIAAMCDPARIGPARVALYRRTLERSTRRSDARDRQAMLKTWRLIEQVGADTSRARAKFGMPAFGAKIAQWVAMGERARTGVA